MELQPDNLWIKTDNTNLIRKIKKAEVKVDSPQVQLQDLISATPYVLICSFDIDGHIIKWNNACEELYGYTYDEICNQKIQQTILQSEEKPLFEVFLRDIKTTLQACIPYEWRTLTHSGQVRYIRSTLSPIVEHGICSEVYCISIDITSQKEAEYALRESQTRYRDLFENSTDLLAILDMKGNILSANRSLAEFISLSRDELLQMNISQLMPHKDLFRIKQRIIEHIRRKIVEPVEYIWEKQNGYQGILEVNIQTLNKDNKPVAIQVTARDITKRRMLEDELNETYRQIIETLIDFIDIKDIYTGKHSQRLVKDCVYLAKQLQLSEREIHDLEVAAILHDVGKIKVPKSILNKFGQLTPEERAVLNQHAATGAQAVEKIPRFFRVSKIIRHHHERYDGSGYPAGIAGNEIPICSRILAVVDAFDAMTNDRPFRKAIGLAEAIEEFERNRASQFDPLIIDIYLDYIKRRYDGEIGPKEWEPVLIEEVTLV